MSKLDTMVILGFLGISGAIVLFPEAIWKILGASLIATIVMIIYSSEMEARERYDRLREKYEKGELDRDYYILEVGGKYFRKHHGELPEDGDK